MSPPRDLVCRVGGAATGVKLGRDGTRCVGAGGDSGSDFHGGIVGAGGDSGSDFHGGIVGAARDSGSDFHSGIARAEVVVKDGRIVE